jgi:hypothetical protein
MSAAAALLRQTAAAIDAAPQADAALPARCACVSQWKPQPALCCTT